MCIGGLSWCIYGDPRTTCESVFFCCIGLGSWMKVVRSRELTPKPSAYLTTSSRVSSYFCLSLLSLIWNQPTVCKSVLYLTCNLYTGWLIWMAQNWLFFFLSLLLFFELKDWNPFSYFTFPFATSCFSILPPRNKLYRKEKCFKERGAKLSFHNSSCPAPKVVKIY